MPDWLTYAQIGARFGMSAEAARLRARRFGWRMQPGNDGRTLVLVPDDAAVQLRPPVRPPGRTGETARLAALLAEERGRAERADRRADDAMARADAADADRRAADARADRERDRADRAEQGREGERARADELRDRLAGLETEVAQHREAASGRKARMRGGRCVRAVLRQDRGGPAGRADPGRGTGRAGGEPGVRAAGADRSGSGGRGTGAPGRPRKARLAALARAWEDAARRSAGRWARLRRAWRGE